MNRVDKSYYKNLFLKHQAHIVVGKKSFSEMIEWAENQLSLKEVPISFFAKERIFIFRQNYRHSLDYKADAPAQVRAFQILQDGLENSYLRGVGRIDAEGLYFILEESSCYIESNCPLFQAQFCIARGVNPKDMILFNAPLMAYLLCFQIVEHLGGMGDLERNQ